MNQCDLDIFVPAARLRGKVAEVEAIENSDSSTRTDLHGAPVAEEAGPKRGVR